MKIELMVIFLVEYLVTATAALTWSIMTGMLFEWCKLDLVNAIIQMTLGWIPFLVLLYYVIGWTFAVIGDD